MFENMKITRGRYKTRVRNRVGIFRIFRNLKCWYWKVSSSRYLTVVAPHFGASLAESRFLACNILVSSAFLFGSCWSKIFFLDIEAILERNETVKSWHVWRGIWLVNLAHRSAPDSDFAQLENATVFLLFLQGIDAGRCGRPRQVRISRVRDEFGDGFWYAAEGHFDTVSPPTWRARKTRQLQVQRTFKNLRYKSAKNVPMFGACNFWISQSEGASNNSKWPAYLMGASFRCTPVSMHRYLINKNREIIFRKTLLLCLRNCLGLITSRA